MEGDASGRPHHTRVGTREAGRAACRSCMRHLAVGALRGLLPRFSALRTVTEPPEQCPGHCRRGYGDTEFKTLGVHGPAQRKQ